MATEDFSQRGEQKQILEYFGGKTDGRFLDIGAADGKTFSTTHALALMDWYGICVEPNPHMLVHLLSLYADRKDILIICAAAVPHEYSETMPSVDMWLTQDFLASSDPDHVATWEKQGVKFRLATVGTWPVGRVGVDYGPDFDMINIDVEGGNVELLKAMDPDVMKRCKLLCIEHDSMDKDVIAICGQYGLKQIHRTEENLILARV